MFMGLVKLLVILQAEDLALSKDFEASEELWESKAIWKNAFALLDFSEYLESFR